VTTVTEREQPWTIRRVLEWATADLKSRSSTSPRLDAELLLAHVLGTDRVRLVIDADKPLSREELDAYKELHRRRRSGEPVAYLRGVREFYGRPFRVDRRVLVPRPETELLVDVALSRTKHLSLSARVLDLCTGSGCVAVTLGKERPTTRVIGADLSDEALVVARDNAVRLGAVANVSFVRSDLFDAFERWSPRPRFDLVTANPPYIATGEAESLQVDIRDFEPHVALFGGDDGLEITRRIVTSAPAWLETGGVLALEIGSGQAGAVEQSMKDAGFDGVQIARDLAGQQRVASGVLR
jgi:release factor glutamine methyltransferase